jgi:outer membrane protein OmpA-like peptidoglycan-associated protein
MKRKRTTGVLLLAAALALSACASLSPQEKSAYAQAQDQVHQLESEPLANQAAGAMLRQARDALRNADEAAKRRNASDTLYWSYLATRRAETGQAMVAELQTRNQIANATAERDRARLAFQRQRAEAAQAQARTARQQAQSAQQQVANAQQQLQAQQQQQQLAAVRAQAQQQVEQARAQAQQQVQAAQQQQTRQQLEALQAKQTARGMVLTLSGSPLFATNSDTLEPGAVRSLQNVAQLMQQHPMMKVRVEGFTDNRGADAYNDALSQRRAQAVAKELQSEGVDPSRLQAIGRGEALPVASNGTAAGRQQNRRVELLFSDAQGRFASAAESPQLR